MIKKLYQKPEAKIVALHQVNILAGTTTPPIDSGGGESDPTPKNNEQTGPTTLF